MNALLMEKREIIPININKAMIADVTCLHGNSDIYERAKKRL